MTLYESLRPENLQERRIDLMEMGREQSVEQGCREEKDIAM